MEWPAAFHSVKGLLLFCCSFSEPDSVKCDPFLLRRHCHHTTILAPANWRLWKMRQRKRSTERWSATVFNAVNNTSVCKYWKILFYPSNTDTGTFYGGSTDIDTDAQYPICSTDILVFPVFYSISILCFKPLIDSSYLRLLAL